MTENIKVFLAKVSADAQLIERLNEAKEYDEIISLAKELGIELTEADFVSEYGEMAEGELDAVAGGGACYCAVGGGGTDGNKDNVCACPLVGFGSYDGYSYAYEEEGSWTRCSCPLAGYGSSSED